jgi:outer membrane protein TolC
MVSSSYAEDTLTVANAIEEGLQHNYSIIIARNAQTIARNNNTLGNAGFLPSVNGNYNNTSSVTSSRSELANGTVRQGNGIHNNTTTASALVNWTVFDGFNMFINKHKLEELEKMGEYQARMNIEITVSQIVTTYYGIVQQEKMLNVIGQAKSLTSQRLSLAKAKREIGSGSEQEYLQALVDFNADSTRYLQQQAIVNNSKADLNRFLGRSIQTPFLVKDDLQLKNDLKLNELLDKVTLLNAQLLAQQAAVNVANYTIGNYRSQYFPAVNLFGGYNYNKNITPVGAATLTQSNGLQYGVTASINIFNGGVTSLNIQNSKILLKSSHLQYEDTKLLVQNEITKFFNNYTTNLQIVNIQKNNVEMAKKDVDIAMARFRVGNISDIDLRVTQQKLIDAEYNLLAAEYSGKQAEIELQRLSGQLMNIVQ